MMLSARLRRLVGILEEGITVMARDHLFERVHQHEWLRRWGWKSDRIRVHVKKDWYVIVNLEVLIPPREGTIFDFDCVGMIDLVVLTGRDYAEYRFPKLPMLDRRYVKRIWSDLPQGFEWFRRNETPDLCLKHLLTPHVNPDSPSYSYCQAYLQQLPPDTERMCCLLNVKHEYPNAYSRALFDVNHRGYIPESD